MINIFSEGVAGTSTFGVRDSLCTMAGFASGEYMTIRVLVTEDYKDSLGAQGCQKCSLGNVEGFFFSRK